MSKIPLLHQHVETVYLRLLELHQSAAGSSALHPDLLPIALKELGTVCEQLQVVLKEFNQQNQKIADAQSALQLKNDRYQQFFKLSLESYLILNQEGIIQEANGAACRLLNLPQSFLSGKSIFGLAVDQDRALLEQKVTEAIRQPYTELSLSLYRYPTDCFDAVLTIAAVAEPQGQALLYCLLRDVTLQGQSTANHSINELYQDRLYHYARGEVISLEPQTLWWVAQGVVKLTTLSEKGEEVLVGLAGKSMMFGSNLTGLATYQAVATSKVKLAAISLNEVWRSPHLTKTMLDATCQRLRQTESFLAIHGQIRVEDRFKQLLLLLKQNFGQSIDRGTRLEIRLTHQDFASACCTTRVTITRLLSRWQQEGKLEIDSQNHLILKQLFHESIAV